MNPNIFSFYAQPPETDPCSMRVAIQPNMSHEGWPATAGSMALENYIAPEDATVIHLLKQTGARIVGSTQMSELGLGLAGNTGSQAVQENMADLALITDNLGEARVAAARAGLVGFKPSYGIVSRRGLFGLIPSMECWGILGRDISKIRTAMAAICINDEQDFSMIDNNLPDFGKARLLKELSGVIGVIDGYENILTKTEKEAWQKAISVIEKAGFRFEKIRMEDFTIFSKVHHVIGSVEASSSAGKYDGVRYGHRTSAAGNWNDMYLKSRGESFGTLIKTYLFQGAYFQFENYAAFENACRIRGRLLDEILNALSRVDCVASLTIREKPDACEVSSIEEIYRAFLFTAPANVTGLPSFQLPEISRYQNRDFGLQITGSPMSDPVLMAIADNLISGKEGGQKK